MKKCEKDEKMTFKSIRGYKASFPRSTFPALQMVPFRREFEEEITLCKGDSVEHDDVAGLFYVTHEDDSRDIYPYKIVYPDDEEKT